MPVVDDCCCCVQADRSVLINVETALGRSEDWAQRSLSPFLAVLQQHGWELDKLFLPRPEWTAEW
jgi:hypothetical protein